MNTLPVDRPAPGSDPSGADSVPHLRAIRSFVRRAGRTTSGQGRALDEWGPRFVVPYQASLQPLAALYPQLAEAGATPGAPDTRALSPLVLEIGFGMGEATAHIAQQMPQASFLCCEVHPPGVGALLKRIGELGLENIRIIAHDAVEVVDHMLPQWSPQMPVRGLDGVHVFFPDPWHKKRHNKRRLIQAPQLERLAARLKPGGYLHCATDWQPYAEQMLEVMAAEPLLHNPNLARHPELGGYAPRPAYRPPTKFEKRGIGLGHGVWDLVFLRR
ncbi:MAG: tRNA (guanosine(46)-N7)-methyltransferase TrmB [Burkholderiaceae bacterium]